MSLRTVMLPSLLLILICLLAIPHITAQRSGGGGGGGGGSRGSSGYRRSGSGSCSTTCGIILGSVFGGIGLIFICILICICMRSKRQKIRREMENQAYLDEPLTNTPSSDFDPTWNPSDGAWHGQYHGTSRLNSGDYAMDVSLTFHDGQITSQNGNDNVGTFTLTGQYRTDTRRLIMMKTYTNIRNDVVHYQGTFTTEYHMSGTWKLPNGDDGTWELYNDAHETTTTSAIAHVQPTAPASYAIDIDIDKPSQPIQATPVSNYHTEPSAPVAAAVPFSAFEIEGHPTAPLMRPYIGNIPNYGTADPIKPASGVTYTYVHV